MAGEARLPQTATVQGVTRLAAGAILGAAFASPAPARAAIQVALLMGLAYTAGKILGLVLGALLNGTDDLP